MLNGTVCTLCPSGKFSPPAATACTACPANLNSPVGSGSCNASYPMTMLVADSGLLRSVNLETSAVSTVSTYGTALVYIAPSPLNDFVLFTSSNWVSKIDLGSMVVTQVAGRSWSGLTDGIGTDARFTSPYGIKISPNASFALVCDYGNNVLRKIMLSTMTVSPGLTA